MVSIILSIEYALRTHNMINRTLLIVEFESIDQKQKMNGNTHTKWNLSPCSQIDTLFKLHTESCIPNKARNAGV